jgi:hypothetical protein
MANKTGSKNELVWFIAYKRGRLGCSLFEFSSNPARSTTRKNKAQTALARWWKNQICGFNQIL